MKAAQALACVLATVILAAGRMPKSCTGRRPTATPASCIILNPANGAVIQDVGPLNDSRRHELPDHRPRV